MLTVGLVSTLTACGSEANSSVATIQVEWPEEITLVQMPIENDTSDSSMHHALRDHLARELGVEVNVVDYEPDMEEIEAVVNEKFDMMLADPVTYYQMNQKAGAELLATLKTEGDDYSAFITKRDNEEIHNMEDLEGKNFAFVTENSFSGYLYPKGTLVQMLDLNPELVEQSGYFFNKVIFTESHENSVIGVLAGEFDAAAVAIGVLENMIDTGMVQPHDFKLIGRTQDIPEASYIVRKSLPEELKLAIREAFVSFDNEHYFSAIHNDPYARFVSPVENYYDPAIDMLTTINAIKTQRKEFIMMD